MLMADEMSMVAVAPRMANVVWGMGRINIRANTGWDGIAMNRVENFYVERQGRVSV